MRAFSEVCGVLRSVAARINPLAAWRRGGFGQRLRAGVLVYAVLCQTMLPVSSVFAQSGNQAPVITYFTCGIIFENYWMFYGTVEDENPGYCVIAFGGCIDGWLCNVEPDGTFCQIVWLDPNVGGPVYAVTRDDHNVESNVTADYVWNFYE